MNFISDCTLHLNCLSVLRTAYQFDKKDRHLTNPWCFMMQCLL